MPTTLRGLAAIAFAALLAAGCNKKESAGPLDGNYSSGDWMSVEPAVLLTAGGSSTDTALIRPFLRRMPAGLLLIDPFVLHGDSAYWPDNIAYVVTISGNRAGIGLPAAEYDVTEQANGTLLFLGRDSLHDYHAVDERCTYLFQRTSDLHPDSSCSDMGSLRTCTYRPLHSARLVDNNLQISLYTIAVKTAGGCKRLFAHEWGSSSTAVQAELQAGDTLVLQRKNGILFRR